MVMRKNNHFAHILFCLQVSDLSIIRQVDYSLSADELANHTPSGESLRHQAPVSSTNHVAVVTVTHDVIRATPPPAYESLFPSQSE